MALYTEIDTYASREASKYRLNGDEKSARYFERISKRPQSIWLGEWSGDVAATVDRHVSAAGKYTCVFVCYYVPQRDGTDWSAGGAPDTTSYWGFVAGIAKGLRGRPAIVILEPDSLCHVDFLSPDNLGKRLRYLNACVDTLTGAGASVYIDAGDSNWIPSSVVAERLVAAGVHKAKGFALNVSHFEYTENEHRFANQLRTILGNDVHYIIDTSRNGLGPKGSEWCNPLGRGLGKSPTITTNVEGCDAYLWVKRPGESDGECNGGPAAGGWWPEYALELARNQVI